MDSDAVWASSEDDLKSLGLTERGHIICLKGFCLKENEPQQLQEELAANIRQSGKERVTNNKRRRKGSRLVFMGWKHFTDGSFRSIRTSKGGGTREKLFDESTTIAELLDIMLGLFYPNDKSFAGRKSQMVLKVGNFQGSVIKNTDITIGDYSKENALQKVRIYLLSKKKSIFDYDYRSDSSSDDFVQQPLSSSTRISHRVESPPLPSSPQMEQNHSTLFDTQIRSPHLEQNNSLRSLTSDRPIPSPPLHQILPPVFGYNFTATEEPPLVQSTSNSQLIGSSSEREKLHSEIAQALEESERIDKEADDKKEHEEIRQRRRSRVPPEPALSEDHIVMSVQHPTLGIKRRVFPADIQMSVVYDWIGSISEDLTHFHLLGRDSIIISPDCKASQFSNQTLLVNETEEAPQESNSDHLSQLMGLREVERERLGNQDEPPVLTVSREQIFDDMLYLFKKRTTTNHLVSIIFKGEDASGDGVTADAFTSFFEKLYELMDGNNQKVPSIRLDDEELIVVGKIINHAFLISNIFPIEISMASFLSVLFQAEDIEILTSFLDFLTDIEKQLIESLYSQESTRNTQPIYDILLEYGITNAPTKENIHQLMLKAGNVALIRNSNYAFKKIIEGMGTFWTRISKKMFVSLYLVTKPTPENIIQSIESEYSSPKDGKITTWLHRYIRGLSNEKLILFLRFVTASSTIQPKLIIQLRFVDQNPGCLRPTSMTCFKILTLPRQYCSFSELCRNMDYYLSNKDHWAVHDA